MTEKSYSNIIGFDDAPFDRNSTRPVSVVGAVYARLRLDGVLTGYISRDGMDATEVLSDMVHRSKFNNHAQLIMLQGITMAGFNVVDATALHDYLGLPVLIVSRRKPNMETIKTALLTRIEKGEQKWEMIKRLGPMEPIAHIFIQRVGLTFDQAKDVISCFSIHSHIPEPIRTAHLIAGALVNGQSRGDP